tara:strand:+ start:1853 stop:1999 length:147 start_codon:yes stop_codon:yes gene_type:complete
MQHLIHQIGEEAVDDTDAGIPSRHEDGSQEVSTFLLFVTFFSNVTLKP